MPFFCPGEGKSGRRVGIGHRDPNQCTCPHHSTHLVSLAPKCDRNALRFEGKRAHGPIWRGLPGASSWFGAPGSAGFPLGQALPGADDLLLYGLVTRVSCRAILRVHQAGPAPCRHVHFDLEKASGTKRKQVHRGQEGHQILASLTSPEKGDTQVYLPKALGAANGSRGLFYWRRQGTPIFLLN